MAVVVKGGFAGPGAGGVNGTGQQGVWRREITCTEEQRVSAILLTSLGCLGVLANLSLMIVIAVKQPLTRWSQGLIFHQAVVDGARAAILLPLGRSIFLCQAISRCSLVETTFLLLVTVSTVNLLTTVLNASPVLPTDVEDGDLDTLEMVRDNPQCVAFGLFMIWFSSITINLGPTFLSGALAANADDHINEPSCPLVQGPYRHYILNVLWILINMLCMLLIVKQLHRLRKEFNDKNIKVTALRSGSGHKRLVSHLAGRVGRDGATKVRIFFVISFCYILFWGPLFTVTLANWSWEWKDAKNSLSHEVTLHIAFVHSFVNPLLFIILHRDTRHATCNMLLCSHSSSTSSGNLMIIKKPRQSRSPDLGAECDDDPGSPGPPPAPPPPLSTAVSLASLMEPGASVKIKVTTDNSHISYRHAGGKVVKL